MPPTLVLPPRFSDDSNALWRAAIALDWPIERLQSWRVPEDFAPENVAIYGEAIWAHFVAQQLEVTLLEPPLSWLADLPSQWTNREVEFGILTDARALEFPRFVKPADEKTFAAQIYHSADELPNAESQIEETAVLWSEIVQFEVEYRCFVLDGKIATASSYWRGEVSTQDENGVYVSSPGELEAALEFASRLCQAVAMPRAVVIDLGIVAGRGWSVIEANPAFGAGIYGCDAREVLPVVAACVVN